MSLILPEACHRTRQHVSLRLDSELSEVEDALVAHHLRRCAACRAFAEDLKVLTETLRVAPLEEPSVRFQLPRRPARIRRVHLATAATTALTAAVAVGVVGLHSPETRIGALDIQTARERMSVKEHLLETLDSTSAKRAQQIRFGLTAAEHATLDRSQSGR